MSRKAIQGFQALRNDNGVGWMKGTKGDGKVMMTNNNNNPPNYTYTARTPTSRGTQTNPTDSWTGSSSPPRKTTSASLPAQHTRSRSPQEMDVTPPPSGCICFRERTSVACCSCGLLLAGRVRMQCPCHPNTIYLMDLERCPECRSATLTELRTT